jgi:hypothetical protein
MRSCAMCPKGELAANAKSHRTHPEPIELYVTDFKVTWNTVIFRYLKTAIFGPAPARPFSNENAKYKA